MVSSRKIKYLNIEKAIADLLAETIKKRRTDLGITQGELASIAGLSYGYICRLERGYIGNPGIGSAARLCLLLDIDIQDLVTKAWATLPPK